ncbi:hypothetical protein SEA_SCUTTLE_2 [Arthrobacter phage Scuttle]|uniref:Minor tail protein n=1 Tax=Arthrobacter phage Scuttle TaxID=2572523 RepID=A0A4D6T4P3_9CAUD|nr:hypothetical protein SEA_SCUTTLE_2 [Arthrobacter phage Scuttle]
MARTPDDPTKAQVWIDNTDPLNPKFEFYFPRGSKGDPGGIVNPTNIGAGYDWNNLIVSGTYYASGADLAGQPNSPPSMAIGVNIIVQARNAAIVTQYANTVSNAHSQILFQRSLVSGVWSPWKVFRNTSIDNSAGKVLTIWDESANRSQMIYGDTGLRQMTLPDNVTAGNWFIRRVGSSVYIYTQFTAINNNTGQDSHTYEVLPAGSIPAGFQPPVSVPIVGFGRIGVSNQRQPITAFLYATGRIALEKDETNAAGAVINNTAASFYFGIHYTTTQVWPASLPGSASGVIPNL